VVDYSTLAAGYPAPPLTADDALGALSAISAMRRASDPTFSAVFCIEQLLDAVVSP
jgi:hypothetical protein